MAKNLEAEQEKLEVDWAAAKKSMAGWTERHSRGLAIFALILLIVAGIAGIITLWGFGVTVN